MSVLFLLVMLLGTQQMPSTSQSRAFQVLGTRCATVWEIAEKAAQKAGNKNVTTAVVTFTPADGRHFSRVCHLTRASSSQTFSDLFVIRDGEEAAVAVWRLETDGVWVVSHVVVKAGDEMTANPKLDNVVDRDRAEGIAKWFDMGDRTIVSVGPMMGRK